MIPKSKEDYKLMTIMAIVGMVCLFLMYLMIDGTNKRHLELEKMLDDRIKKSEMIYKEKQKRIGEYIVVKDSLKIVKYDIDKNMFLLDNGMYME